MRGQKALPCYGQPWARDLEFGTHKLNLSSGFKKLCPASGWEWLQGVVARGLGQSLLAMEVKKERVQVTLVTARVELGAWKLLIGSQTIVASELNES